MNIHLPNQWGVGGEQEIKKNQIDLGENMEKARQIS